MKLFKLFLLLIGVQANLLSAACDTKAELDYSLEDMPFHWIAENIWTKKECQELVKIFVDSGLPINEADKNGQTALHHVAINSNIFMFEALIENGAKLELKDKLGNTPLNWSDFVKNLYISQQLRVIINKKNGL